MYCIFWVICTKDFQNEDVVWNEIYIIDIYYYYRIEPVLFNEVNKIVSDFLIDLCVHFLIGYQVEQHPKNFASIASSTKGWRKQVTYVLNRFASLEINLTLVCSKIAFNDPKLWMKKKFLQELTSGLKMYENHSYTCSVTTNSARSISLLSILLRTTFRILHHDYFCLFDVLKHRRWKRCYYWSLAIKPDYIAWRQELK